MNTQQNTFSLPTEAEFPYFEGCLVSLFLSLSLARAPDENFVSSMQINTIYFGGSSKALVVSGPNCMYEVRFMHTPCSMCTQSIQTFCRLVAYLSNLSWYSLRSPRTPPVPYKHAERATFSSLTDTNSPPNTRCNSTCKRFIVHRRISEVPPLLCPVRTPLLWTPGPPRPVPEAEAASRLPPVVLTIPALVNNPSALAVILEVREEDRVR